MASQIRHLKSKVLQYRSMVEQLRREVAELTRTNLSLTEGAQQRSLSDYDPSELPNANGKRAMMRSAQQRKTASSPLVAPAGPDRLTLPLQQAPSFSPRESRGPGGIPQIRQGSSPYAAADPRIDAKQYSYQAPGTSQARLPRRSGTIQTFERVPGGNFAEQLVPSTSYLPSQPRVENQHSRFTPSSTNGSVDLGPNARKLPPPAKVMGPPPTPQNVLRHVDTGQDRSMETNGRFAPPSTTPRRFAPRIEATRSLAPVAPVSRAPTNTQNAYGGHQRAPFMPGNFG
ncbi:hypothetical protein ONZ45_g3598 [Pleurotus djamor]|nr:hypothetical protein ONZ45_g3598 [Pleurotus djamor]